MILVAMRWLQPTSHTTRYQNPLTWAITTTSTNTKKVIEALVKKLWETWIFGLQVTIITLGHLLYVEGRGNPRPKRSRWRLTTHMSFAANQLATKLGNITLQICSTQAAGRRRIDAARQSIRGRVRMQSIACLCSRCRRMLQSQENEK